MRILILADIHANLSALRAVLEDAEKYAPDAAVFLGDLIDYGMRPNETAEALEGLSLPLLGMLRGNHEDALLRGDTSRFSSPRGAVMSRYTGEHITPRTRGYLGGFQADGHMELRLEGRRVLLVHGSLEDPFWGGLAPESDLDTYRPYDLVLSAHTHRPHCFARYFPSADSPFRGEKKTVFLNPGSVGQPRNHDPRAQYAVLDLRSGEVVLAKRAYPVEDEQALYPPELPDFYRRRLALGI